MSFDLKFGELTEVEGENGATFIPAVSEDGVISWTNNKGLENPAPVNIKGKDGEPGQDGKSAYEYAQEAGYTGTAEAFAAKLAEDNTPSILLAMYNEVDVTPMDEDLILFDEETATITGFDVSTQDKWSRVSALEECVIPYAINGILVKNIEKVNNIVNAKKIRFPNSIIKIGNNACAGLTALQSINIPTSCEYIGLQAFSGTSLIEVITPIKPNWEIEIGEGAFSATGGLNNIDTIIDGIKEIPKRAFYECEAVKAVTVPESVDTVGVEAFGKCANLLIVTILNPNAVLAGGFCDSGVIIKGYTGSTAETYAKDNDHPFIAIDTDVLGEAKRYTDKVVGDIDSLLSEV